MMIINHIESSFWVTRMVDPFSLQIKHAWLVMSSKFFFKQFQIFIMILNFGVKTFSQRLIEKMANLGIVLIGNQFSLNMLRNILSRFLSFGLV